MKTQKNIGVIACGGPGNIAQLASINTLSGYILKKIFLNRDISANIVKSHHPETEIVSNQESILNDSAIELVLISSPTQQDIDIVGAVVQSGKAVRIV
jgi:predicted dehydrogenase